MSAAAKFWALNRTNAAKEEVAQALDIHKMIGEAKNMDLKAKGNEEIRWYLCLSWCWFQEEGVS